LRPVSVRSVADPKGSRASAAVDGAGVHSKNAINVVMEDLAEEDRKEVEQELDEGNGRDQKEEAGLLPEDAQQHHQEGRHDVLIEHKGNFSP
jgi:hypothetical protein